MAHEGSQPVGGWRVLPTVAGVVLAVNGVWFLMIGKAQTLLAVLCFIASAYFLFGRKGIRRLGKARRFNQRLDQDVTIRWEITSKVLVSYDSEGEDGRITWDMLHQIAIAKQGVLLYIEPSKYYWFPESGFNPSHWERFNAWVDQAMTKLEADEGI